MKQKIGIIGHIGADKSFYDGQTIKTKALLDAMKKYCADDFETVCADTYYIRHNVFRFAAQLLRCLFLCDEIIVLLSNKGRRVLFPLLYLAVRISGKRIFHFAIGGRLADEAENARVRKYISSFRANWVESWDIAERLVKMGVENAEYMPNFRELAPPVSVGDRSGAPYTFCTFSRVVKEKGISDAISAVCEVNRELGDVARLDIYGHIAPEYKAELEELLTASKGQAIYRGAAAPEESGEILSRYYMLLFPTYHYAEGIPGTVIEALAAGLPVIARKWQYCDEMLEHGVTGYCYPHDEPEALPFWIKTAIGHADDVRKMREECLDRAAAFSAEVCIGRIRSALKRELGE